jgi:hypothetical protein
MLTLREECRLRVFENWVLRGIFGPKRDELRGCGPTCSQTTSSKQYTHLRVQQYTTHILSAVHTSNTSTQPRWLSRFGHQKVELTIVLLKMGTLVPET